MPQHEARKQRAKALNWASHNIKSQFIDNLTIESLVSSDSKYEQIMITQLGYSQIDINRFVIQELIDNIILSLEKLENSKLTSNEPFKSAHLLQMISSKCLLLMSSKYSLNLIEKLCSSTVIEKLSNLANCRSDLSYNFNKNLIKYNLIDKFPLETKLILWRKSTYILQNYIESLIEEILNIRDLTKDCIKKKLHDIIISCRAHPSIYHYFTQYIKMLFIKSKNNLLITIGYQLNEGLIETFNSTELNKFYTPITTYKLYFAAYMWPIISILIQEPQNENQYLNINNCVYKLILEDSSRRFDVWYTILQFYNWFIYAKKYIQVSNSHHLKQFIHFIVNPNDDSNIKLINA